MFFLEYYWTMLILVPGIIFAAYAQHQVSSAYKAYSKVPTKNGMTGADAARRNKIMRLSSGVGQQASVAAVGIAAHETGHAIQDKEGYWPLRFRGFIVPITGFASNLAWPIFFVGLFFGQASGWGTLFMNLGIILFSFSLFFTVITLPVEFNASKRAITALVDNNLLQPGEEVGVKKVLRAAALTYVAAALMSLLTLIRLVILRGSRD
jgi:hypothetical protein